MSANYTGAVSGASVLRRHLLGTIATGALIALAIPAQAQESSAGQTNAATTTEQVVVTGSRRSDTTALTSMTPISVVNTKNIEQTGAVDLDRVLQYQVPSFNFPQDSSSNSVQQAPKGVSIHGLQADQTLILINGNRVHLNAQLNTNYLGYGRGTQIVDINTIPADSVARLEVLQDGASAQYGSDAIAGVVNLILKNDDEFRIRGSIGGYTSIGQGFKSNVSVSYGTTFANGGYIHATLEGVRENSIDIGVPDTRTFYFAGDPREATVNRHWFYGNGVLNKVSLMVNGEIPLTDDITAFGYLNASYRQNYGFGSFRRPNDNGNVRAIYPEGFQPIQLIKSSDFENAIGLRDENTFAGKLTLTGSYGTSAAPIYIYNTVNASLGTASGTRGSSGATFNDDYNLTLDQVKDFDLGFMASPLTFASGLAYRHERYNIRAGDPFTWVNGGQPILDGPSKGIPAALGSQSASGFQPADAGVTTRDVFGTYVDFGGKPFTWLDLDFAGRAENYSDFGWTTNGKISARAQALDWLAFRGTVGTGFRAPSIAQLAYSRTSGIFINNVQFLARLLPTTSAPAAALGAQPLKPEKSSNVSAGVVVTPWDRGVFTADIYRINVDDRIILTGALNGGVVSSILSTAGFANLQGAQFFTNALSTKTKGIDIVARQGFEVYGGSLDLSASYSWVGTQITRTAPNPGPLSSANLTLIDRQQKGFITNGSPDNKLVLSGTYSYEPISFTASTTEYGRYKFFDITNAANDQVFHPQWVFSLNAQWDINEAFKIDFGADNVFNSHPDVQIPAERSPIVSLYSPYSPVGAYGMYTYAKLSYKL